MKGRTPTKEQKRFHDNLCQHVGCPACYIDGIFNDYVSVHHIDGRTKPDAHWKVIAACGNHHQIGDGCEAIHRNKARFIKQYGTEMFLHRMSVEILLDKGIEVPEQVLIIAGFK
ncbi:recombinase [Budviciaceae bacterium CWB-B4]|uniref:Recombinase n=1 Tax=Limnobaculum xujianqingii TaxID=2738837 RepID=A0A9D7AM85_9GAMM|nr:Ref family recombination enhancement nuclease [Limnobaculum xujianqingii]MBK5075161.1 recombinase [Limnobaculum xujianqingii]MBK5178471.1 recombinase [Limnobaculum xujianqingii]